MGKREFVKKTIEKDGGRNKGYKYHNYRTSYNGSGNFKLYHYGTCILNVDTESKEIEDYYCCSVSDQESINLTIGILKSKGMLKRGNYFMSKRKLYKSFEYNDHPLNVPFERYQGFKERFESLNEDKKQEITELLSEGKQEHVSSFIKGRDYKEIKTNVKSYLKHSNKVKSAYNRYKKVFKESDSIQELEKGYFVRVYRGWGSGRCLYIPYSTNKEGISELSGKRVMLGRIMDKGKLKSKDKEKMKSKETKDIDYNALLSSIQQSNKELSKRKDIRDELVAEAI